MIWVFMRQRNLLFHKWQIADSAPLNPKIAKLIGIPHDGCQDHCLDNEGKDMEDHTPELTQLGD